MRAVWATDYQEGCLTDIKESTPFTTPTINTRQRYEIVGSLPIRRSTTLVRPSHYVPQPIQVNQLMLSTLGAWMNTQGSWNSPVDVQRARLRERKVLF